MDSERAYRLRVAGSAGLSAPTGCNRRCSGLQCLRRRVECGDCLAQEGQLVGLHSISLQLHAGAAVIAYIHGAGRERGLAWRGRGVAALPRVRRVAARHLVEDENVGTLDLLAQELDHLPRAVDGRRGAEVRSLLQLVSLLELLLWRCRVQSQKTGRRAESGGTQSRHQWPHAMATPREPPSGCEARCRVCTVRGARKVDPSTAVTIE